MVISTVLPYHFLSEHSSLKPNASFIINHPFLCFLDPVFGLLMIYIESLALLILELIVRCSRLGRHTL